MTWGRRDLARALLTVPVLALVGCGEGTSSGSSSPAGATPAAPQPSIPYDPDGAEAPSINGGAFVLDRERRELIASSEDGLVVWEIGTPAPVRTMPGADGSLYGSSAAGRVLVQTSDRSTLVSAADGSEIARHEVATPVSGESQEPSRAAVHDSAAVAVVAGGRDRELRAWDLEAGTSRVVTEDLDLVVGVAVVDEGTALLLTHRAEEPGRLRRVSLTDGAESDGRETPDPRALAHHPGRDLAAVAGVDSPGKRSIRFYEGPSGDEIGHVADLPGEPVLDGLQPGRVEACRERPCHPRGRRRRVDGAEAPVRRERHAVRGGLARRRDPGRRRTRGLRGLGRRGRGGHRAARGSRRGLRAGTLTAWPTTR